MNRCMLAVCMAAVGTAVVFPCRAGYPTIERAQKLFSQENLANQELDFCRDAEYNDFLNSLWTDRLEVSETDQFRMKTFFLTTLTSIVVRVSTNAVDDGTATYALEDRGFAFFNALCSFGSSFTTNVTDCLTVAAYIDRVHPVFFPETETNRFESVFYITWDEKEREAWLQKRRARQERRNAVLALQRRVRSANDSVRSFRRDLFGLCNSCVRANRELMDDTEFAAFTNRVVELSKPSEGEKRRLFNHLDEVKRE